jgi:hypothetical protein
MVTGTVVAANHKEVLFASRGGRERVRVKDTSTLETNSPGSNSDPCYLCVPLSVPCEN